MGVLNVILIYNLAPDNSMSHSQSTNCLTIALILSGYEEIASYSPRYYRRIKEMDAVFRLAGWIIDLMAQDMEDMGGRSLTGNNSSWLPSRKLPSKAAVPFRYAMPPLLYR